MNHLMLQNLKELLIITRKRMSKIEERRADYCESSRWKELKRKETTICRKIVELRKDIEVRVNEKNSLS